MGKGPRQPVLHPVVCGCGHHQEDGPHPGTEEAATHEAVHGDLWRWEEVGSGAGLPVEGRGVGDLDSRIPDAEVANGWDSRSLGEEGAGGLGPRFLDGEEVGALGSWVLSEEGARGWDTSRPLGEEGARAWIPRSGWRREPRGPMPGPYLSGRAYHKPSVCLGPSVQTEPSQVAGLSAPWVPQIP